MLLQAERGPELRVKAPHGCDVGWLTCGLCQRRRLIVLAHVRVHRESEQARDAGLPDYLVSMLPLRDDFELRENLRIELCAARDCRQIEQPEAESIPALIPLACNAIGVTPGVTGIIECSAVDDGPVQEVVARIVR